MFRVLFVSPFLPWPLRHGGAMQRTHLMWRALAERGEVELMLLMPPDAVTPDDLVGLRREFNLAAHFPWPEPRPAGLAWRLAGRLPLRPNLRGPTRYLLGIPSRFAPSPAASAWLTEQTTRGRYQAIIAHRLRSALVSGVPARRRPPMLLDIDDVESLKAWGRTHAAHPPSIGLCLLATAESLQFRHLEKRHFPRFDHLWFASPEDQAHFGVAHSSVLPNVPFIPPGAEPLQPFPEHTTSRELLFVGHLGWQANQQGLDRFLTRVYPKVRATVPDVRFRIVGVSLTEADRRRWENVSGVEVTGFLERLEDAYAQCALTVSPIHWGGGTKIKVIESLAYGRTCVVTPHALYGYGSVLRHGDALWCAHNDDAFSEGCIRLLRDRDLRTTLSTRGRELVATHFTSAAFRRSVHEALDRVVRRSAP